MLDPFSPAGGFDCDAAGPEHGSRKAQTGKARAPRQERFASQGIVYAGQEGEEGYQPKAKASPKKPKQKQRQRQRLWRPRQEAAQAVEMVADEEAGVVGATQVQSRRQLHPKEEDEAVDEAMDPPPRIPMLRALLSINWDVPVAVGRAEAA